MRSSDLIFVFIMAQLLRNAFRWTGWTAGAGLALALHGCGGGGGDAGIGEYTGPLPFEDAPLVASASVAGTCTDLRQKQFVRSLLDEVYLWPEQVQRRDPLGYGDVHGYFDAILAPSTLDRFSFSSTTAAADQREEGESFDVGIEWRNVAASGAAPVWRIARVTPGSPAAAAGLRRGDTLLGRVQTNLFAEGASAPYFYNFDYRRGTQVGVYSASLVPALIEEDPVGEPMLIRQDNRKIGYIAFESHYGDAQDQLIDAAKQAVADGIDDLVLDLRYNSGGFLYMAASLASMIAPTTSVAGEPDFVRLVPNSKRQADFRNEAIPLSPTVQFLEGGARYTAGTELPNLNLQRVYVLITGATCSASESLINGLRGIGVTVHLIGSTTCGKPYGMVRKNNCGNAFYPVEYRGVNALGQADFVDGFAPTCRLPDDLDRERGDPEEAMLHAALTHMSTGACPPNTQGVSARSALAQMSLSPRGAGSDMAYEPPRRERPGLALIHPR